MDALEEARSRLTSHHLYLRKDATVEIQHGVRGPSLRRTLVEEVTLVALKHARTVGADVEEYKALAGKGCKLIDEMQHEIWKGPITFDQSVDYTRAWHFWQHAKNPLDLIASGKAPKIWRETMEAVAAEYVALPYRAPQLERLIVDILIALELYAFGNEVIYEPTQLPWAMRWSQRRVPRKRLRELLKLMKDAYGELASGGMVSTRRLRELVTKAADAGVAWPSPLIAVLDDNISRSGRLEPVDQSWMAQ